MSESPRVRCPRCAYELRGLVEAWREQCPLQGMCAECGLAIEWSELLSAKLQRPRWCIEYARTNWQFLKRIPLTIVMALWPWSMWRRLKMTHPPKWRRLIGAIVLAIVVMLISGYVLARLSMALSFHLRLINNPNVTTTVTAVEACARAVFMPWSNVSPGMYSDPSMPVMNWSQAQGRQWTTMVPTAPYPSPAQLWGALNRTYWWSYYAEHWVLAFCFASLVLMMVPPGFLALPISRRQAKVTMRHPWRVGAYSLAWLAVPAFMYAMALILAIWELPSATLFAAWAMIACFAGAPIFAFLFWQAAVSRYLRMSQSAVIAICVTAMALAAATMIVFYATNRVSPAEMWEMVQEVFD